METNVVKVKLWGNDVGYLSWDKKAGVAFFEYKPSFLEQGLNIAPLTMPIDSPRSQKQLPWKGSYMIKKFLQFFSPAPNKADLKEDKAYLKKLQWSVFLCCW